MKTKLICIYLPQFHRIKENDKWWGEGFTEWTNVKRGKPYYPGHYQPRIPLNENYYDLSNIEELEKHTKMAKDAHIYGFAFYHYYFKGRKLLEHPIEQYRDNSREQFPYCLIWANQSWTRTWYRADIGDKMLLEQKYGDKGNWKDHFEYLVKFFRDERYIKLNNKPVYIIYLPQDMDCRIDMFEYWNNLALKSGFEGLYLIAMNTWDVDKVSSLYDAYMNFEPLRAITQDNSWRTNIEAEKIKMVNKISSNRSLINYAYMRNTFTYEYLCQQIEKGSKPPSRTKTLFGTFAGWDNTSRKDEAGIIVRNSSPKRFRKHIERMLQLSEKESNEFLFLNAWNEWSEGAYIEPDMRYGKGYLQELAKGIENYERL